MGLLRRRKPADEEGRTESAFTLRDPNLRWIVDYLGGNTTASGRSVTPESAIGGTVAVYACVSLLADSVATMPCLLYGYGEDDTRQRIPDAGDAPANQLARLLHRAPNPEMTPQEFFEAVQGHNSLWGNHYSYLVRNGGQVKELWPLRPDAMSVYLFDPTTQSIFDAFHADPTNGDLRRVYLYTLPSGERRVLPRENVLHVRALATDGYVGLSPISVARNAVALEQAATEHGARFFSQGATPGGALVFPAGPKNLSKDDRERIRSEWNARHQGLDNAHRLAILEGGVTWQSIGMPMDDAQWIETRRFQIDDIARLFRIPPHLISDVERSTSWGTGIEQQNLGYLTYTLRPWLIRIEQALNRDLGYGRGGRMLSDLGYTPEFLVEALLRADTKSRMEAYEIAIRNRIMVPNEARRRENLLPLDGGDEPLVSVNLQTESQAAAAASAAAGVTRRASSGS